MTCLFIYSVVAGYLASSHASHPRTISVEPEIFVIHGGISIAEEGGIICGGGCNGDDGGGCGIACSNDKFTTK